MAGGRLLLVVAVVMVAAGPHIASCYSESAQVECNPSPGCELVRCAFPEDCQYGTELLPCTCCPRCAQPPGQQQQQQQEQEQVPSSKGWERTRRALPARRGGTARQMAKTHKLQYYADIPQEARDFMAKIKAASERG